MTDMTRLLKKLRRAVQRNDWFEIPADEAAVLLAGIERSNNPLLFVTKEGEVRMLQCEERMRWAAEEPQVAPE